RPSLTCGRLCRASSAAVWTRRSSCRTRPETRRRARCDRPPVTHQRNRLRHARKGIRVMSTDTAAMDADPAVRPFHVDIAEEAITDLRRRIAAWRPPEREPVDDPSQGVQIATVQDLANYWATEYDWRRCEAKLNAHDQFITTIDGLDGHFTHDRSPKRNASPLSVS